MTKDKNETQGIFTFLKRVKDGEYAPIETSSLPYARIEEKTEFNEEVYYYGIS
jgi:hypothetical protein